MSVPFSHTHAALLPNSRADLPREAELALRASEQKFRSMAENCPDLMCRHDAQGRIVYVSPNLSDFTSLAEEEVLGRTLDELKISPDYIVFMLENMTRVRELRLPVQSRLCFRSSRGFVLTIEVRLWPEFDHENNIAFVSAYIRDISSMLRTEQSYRALFSSMVDGFAFFELLPAGPEREEDFILLLLNPAFARMHSLSENRALGRSLFELLGSSAMEWRRIFLQVLHSGNSTLASIHDTELGRYFELSLYSPETGRIACIAKDVTDLRLSDEKIRLNEARQTALYAISQLDDNLTEDELILFALDKATRLTGSKTGALFFKAGSGADPSRHFWVPGAPMPDKEKKRRSDLSRSILEGIYNREAPPGIYNSPAFFPSRMSVPGHARRYMLASIMEKDKIVCVAGVADKAIPYEPGDLRQLELFINGMWQILRRRWTMGSLTRAKMDAEQASLAKNEFLANVSHELRTPLNGVLGMLQLLQMSDLTREQRDCVETANFSSNSLLRVISDILDFSRAEAGKMELRRQPFSLAQVLSNALDIFTHDARHKQLDFALHVEPTVPSLLMGDDARLRQIIFNVVGNAIKFTEEGRVHVHCSMLPRSFKGNASIYITVEDTGIGIPEDKLGYIFQAFTQLDGSSTRAYSGTGLGLGIVRRLVALLDGSICVESTVGQGTVMHISLPFELPPSLLPVAAPDSAGIRPSSRPLRILVAEDDPVSQVAVRGMLMRLGHKVFCVENGSLALESLARDDFDCLLSDIQMPVMSGTELLRRILEDRASGTMRKNSAIPVIALTAHAMAGDRERFLAAGFDEYVAKPIVIVELQKALSMLAQKMTTAAAISAKELP